MEADDVVEMPRWLVALSWWTDRNVEIAVARPSDHHGDVASGRVTALLQGEHTVRERQRFIVDAIARL
jgi:hypothetical protein